MAFDFPPLTPLLLQRAAFGLIGRSLTLRVGKFSSRDRQGVLTDQNLGPLPDGRGSNLHSLGESGYGESSQVAIRLHRATGITIHGPENRHHQKRKNPGRAGVLKIACEECRNEAFNSQTTSILQVERELILRSILIDGLRKS